MQSRETIQIPRDGGFETISEPLYHAPLSQDPEPFDASDIHLIYFKYTSDMPKIYLGYASNIPLILF